MQFWRESFFFPFTAFYLTAQRILGWNYDTKDTLAATINSNRYSAHRIKLELLWGVHIHTPKHVQWGCRVLNTTSFTLCILYYWATPLTTIDIFQMFSNHYRHLISKKKIKWARIKTLKCAQYEHCALRQFICTGPHYLLARK